MPPTIPPAAARDTSNGASFSVQKRRLRDRLFPSRHLEPPQADGFAESWITSEVVVRFDWLDRLRILVSGHVRVLTYTQTDVHVERARGRSVAYVVPPGRNS